MASMDAFWSCLIFVIIFVLLSGHTNSQELGFIQDPQDVIITKSFAFRWDCIPQPDLSGAIGKVTWKKDGQTMELSNRHQILSNGSLYFSYVRGKKSGVTDEGQYQCCVDKNITSGIIGTECSKKAYLTIAAKPIFTSLPEPVITRLGGVARFFCGIDAAPPATVKWHHGKNAIGEDEGSGDGVGSKFTVLPGGALQIVDVTEQETGEYRCVVQNIAGKRQSQPVMLLLNSTLRQPTDVVFIKSPDAIVRKRHTNVVMECFVDLPESCTVAWIHRKQDGKIVELSSRASSIGRNNLMLQDLSSDDSGLYFCQVLQAGSVVAERIAKLTVVAPPIIEEPPEEPSDVIVGRNIHLRCRAIGQPKPKITWYKNGMPVVLDERFTIPEGDMDKLSIFASQVRDTGIYQCFAENPVGSMQASVAVKFKIKSGRPDPPFNVQVEASDSQKLLVTWSQSIIPVLGYGVHYFETSGGIDKSIFHDSYPVEIPKLHPFTNYTIYVLAYNSNGVSDPSEYVYIRTQPDKPTDVPKFSLASNTATSLDIKWQKMPLEYANGVIIQYSIQYREYGDKTSNDVEVNGKENGTVINDLRPGSEYEVRISAATIIGKGPWSGWTKKRTLIPGTRPGDITAPNMRTTFVNQSVIFVQWEPVDDNILGYKISYYTVDGVKAGPVILAPNVTDYTITGLKPLSTCTVSLLAYTVQQEGSKTVQTITTHTASGTPWDPSIMPTPEKFNVTAETTTSVTLSWMWPYPNLEVTKYVIKYGVSGTAIVDIDQPNFVQYIPDRHNIKERVTIDGLEPSKWYTFAIQAEGEESVSSFSQQVNCRTPQNKPSSPPTNVNARPIDAHTVEMRWHPPAEPNGPILTYIIMYNVNESQPDEQWLKQEKTYDEVHRPDDQNRKDDLLTQINNLDSNTKYYFRMRARNNNGDSPSTKIVSVLTLVDMSASSDDDDDDDDDTSTRVMEDTLMGLMLGFGIVVGCIFCCVAILLGVRRYVNKQAERYRQSQAATNDALVERVRTYVNQSNWPDGQAQLDQLIPMFSQSLQPNFIDAKGSSDTPIMMRNLSPSTYSTPSTSRGHQISHQYQRTSAKSSEDGIEVDIHHDADDHDVSFDGSRHMSSINNMEGSSQDTGISSCHGDQDSPKSASMSNLQNKVWQQESSGTSSEESNASSKGISCDGEIEPSGSSCPTIERTMFNCAGGNALPRIFDMPHVREYTV
ncbi:protogenin B-like [Antedon mediterranea]|uniref:protogenin B-like n=1 Tax=Antedon mediterranea TaxID=105859 RepID=UPI003AF7C87E